MCQWEQKKDNFFPLAVSTTLIILQPAVGLGPKALSELSNFVILIKMGENWQEHQHKFHTHISGREEL